MDHKVPQEKWTELVELQEVTIFECTYRHMEDGFAIK